MAEAALYPSVKRFLEAAGFAVKGEVCGCDIVEVRRDIADWLGKWQAKYPRLCNWVEDNIEETLTYYRLPLPPPQAHEVD